MLQTRADLETELTNRLMVANNSALFPAARITELIKQSYRWAGSLHFWPSLQKARTTTALKNTQALNYDYYDYPSDFLTDSVSRVYIDGKKYELKTFQSFLDYVDQTQITSSSPDTSKRYVANYGRQYFIWPSYTGVAPANNLLVWGNIQPLDLALSTDTTIFSTWDDAGNEAIVKKALSIALARLESGYAGSELQGANQLLEVMWKKVTDEMQKAQPLNHPRFDVPNFFGIQAGVSTVGTFNVSNLG